MNYIIYGFDIYCLKATKYNFSNDEKLALTQVISCIKGVQALLSRASAKFTVAIHTHVYSQMQEFIQTQLREPLRKHCKKKGKENVRK